MISTFDPAYGIDFPNLGWRGKATFDVAPSCLLVGSGSISTPCSGIGLVTTLSTTVELYSLSDPGSTTLKTLTFTPATVNVNTLWFTGGLLQGAESTLSNYVLDDVVTGVTFALQFTYDPAPGGYRGPKLFWQDPITPALNGVNDPNKRPTVTFVVPEPASLPLAVLALLAAGCAAGKRRPRTAV